MSFSTVRSILGRSKRDREERRELNREAAKRL
jgi:hypothetical protein